MTTLVTGARGKVGHAVLTALHTAGLPVRAASSDPAALTVPAGVEAVALRFDAPETFDAALTGVDQVFLYAAHAGVDSFLTAARAAGVEHIVLLSSSSVESPDVATHPIGAQHYAVENALIASGITATVLRPGAFASNSFGWARSIGTHQPIEHPYPEAGIAPIHTADIADIAVAALTGATALRGRTVTLTGGQTLTFRTQIALLADAIGREIPITTITHDEALQQMSAAMPAGIAESLLTNWAAATARPETIADTTETLLGKPARTFRQWAQDNAAAFTRS
ncbi:NAD(P)H-binding protein [Nocardia sp. NBC_01327]|uniref:NAD(P)H-binding protein n=1 Tax=Nocardia sp. NBC_01327 TaxID=2903593 RepID=UPI002E100C41|nr:NAD(P)H-binding protein [Nocardia sp. NBC_01327]